MFDGKNPRHVSQRGVRLCTVLVSEESDSAQCQSARSPALHSVSQHGVRLCTELVSVESNSAQCQPLLYFLKKSLVDSVHCQSILDFRNFNFMTPRSVSRLGVTYFAKTNLSVNHFSLFTSGKGGLDSQNKKKPKIS